MSFEHASQDELVAVADLVVGVLAEAGIRSTFDSEAGSESRAYLIIDDGDDGRGVYVTWQLPDGGSGVRRDDDPAVLQAGRTKADAVGRLQRVLRSAGVEAAETDPDFFPFYLEILSVPGSA